MKRKIVLDSFAILAYLNQEVGFEEVKQILNHAQDLQQFVLMNEINIGETYYILYRKRGKETSESFINNILPNLPILIVSNTLESIIETAKIKAHYPISYADAFAVSTAVKEDAVVVTGDPEFEKVQHLISVKWLVNSRESK